MDAEHESEHIHDHLTALLSMYFQCKSGWIDYNLVALL